MERSIYRYILRHSLRQQIVLTIMAAASFPFLYAFYELPKEIVNRAIQGKGVEFPVVFGGFEFDQLDYLWFLSALFLGLVAINQSFKYVINVYRGLTGERMLRRLRYELYKRVLRFPLPTFRKTSQGEVIQMITAETEPLGGFIGDAFALPAFQGGTLLVILGFLLFQNVYMALAAIAFYPLQFWIIPKLQRKVNNLGKQRVRLVRRLAERIGETISGVQEVHAHDASGYELARFSRGLGDIFWVRYYIFVWKFVIKFVNNTINQLGPLCFYAIGGYFVIMGTLEIGTLIAAIAAYKDLAAPWKELLTYYQMREDARIKYDQVVEQFDPPGILDEALLEEPETVPEIDGALSATNLSLRDDTGTPLLEGVSFEIAARRRVAVVGAGGSGRDELLLVLARLLMPSGGSLLLDGMRLADLPEAVTGRQMGYVGVGAAFFSGTLRDNLYYSLKHRPVAAPDYTDEEQKEREKREAEALAAGNTTDDPEAEWIDYAAADAADAEALSQRAIEALSVVEMERDLYDLGLRGTIDPEQRPDLAERFLAARAALHERLASDPTSAALVEEFDENKYNDNATVAENLFFGTPVGATFDMDRLAEHPYVLSVLQEAGLTDDLLEVGREVAATMVELFADLPPGHHFFEQFSFIGSDDLPEFQALLARIARSGMGELRPEERTRLMSLPFKLQPARHRLDVIDDALRERLLGARRIFARNLPEELKASVEFYERDRYNAAATLQDNILFGKLAYGQPQGAERLGRIIGEVIDSLDLRRAVMEVGLDFNVGIGGGRLSGVQRQKVALARALLKRPQVLIVNDALAALDGGAQVRILDRVLERFADRSLIWVLSRPSLASRFEHVLVIQSGRVIESGPPADLDAEGKALYELIKAE